MSQLAGRTLRRWVARSTGSYMLSALIGTISGALTQSTNAITVILMSLAAADLISVKRAKPILAWANIGTAALVLLAAADIKAFVYALVALAGLCYYAKLDRSARWRPVVSALLAVGLLMLGIELMHGGSDQFHDLSLLKEVFIDSARWQGSALLIGIVLALVTQSPATVSVLAIALVGANLVSFDQAMLTVYGASIGSGLATGFIALRTRGVARQIAAFEVIIKLVAIGVLLPLYLIERYAGVPLLAAAIEQMASEVGNQVALVYIACQVATVAAQILIGDAIQPFLDRFSPPQQQESLMRPHYLYDQAVDDPETAVTLVDREQARIFALLPLYFGLDEHLGDDMRGLKRTAILPVALALGRSVGDFLHDLADTGAERSVLEAISDRQARNTLLISAHEAMADLVTQLAEPFDSVVLRELGYRLREGLGALLLTAEEAVRSLDPDDIAVMRRLTSDRDSLVESLRRGAIGADRGLTAADHRRLYTITSLLELVFWILRRYSALLVPATETEGIAAPPVAAEALNP